MPYKDPEKQKEYLAQYAERPDNKGKRKKVNHRYYANKRYGSEDAFIEQKYDRIFADKGLVFEYVEKEWKIKRKRRNRLRAYLRSKQTPPLQRARRWRSNRKYYRKSEAYQAAQERKAARARRRLAIEIPLIMRMLARG